MTTTNGPVQLRPVLKSDLPVFFEQQCDPVAVEMAAFPARERTAFMQHWLKILANDPLNKMTVLFGDEIAGHIVGYEQAGQQQVGYWLGQEYWGQGIATQALSLFLAQVETRPLYAYVAQHNHGSRRVLEKCGFTILGQEHSLTGPTGESVAEFIMKLEAAKT
jgi:RimJ/RimL family protein N-acetyltransferase